MWLPLVGSLLQKILHQLSEVWTGHELRFDIRRGGGPLNVDWDGIPGPNVCRQEHWVGCEIPSNVPITHSAKYVGRGPNLLETGDKFLSLLLIPCMSE